MYCFKRDLPPKCYPKILEQENHDLASLALETVSDFDDVDVKPLLSEVQTESDLNQENSAGMDMLYTKYSRRLEKDPQNTSYIYSPKKNAIQIAEVLQDPDVEIC